MGTASPTGSFARTVSALASCIVRERCAGSDEHVEAVARAVLAQYQRMPDFLRGPIRLATLAFDAVGVVHAGRPFHRASHVQRRRQLDWGRRTRIGPCRNLVRFYENLIVHAWYSAAAYGP